MSKKEIIFEEASGKDAASFLKFMKLVATETDFLVMEKDGLSFTIEEMTEILDSQLEAPDQLILLAKVDEAVVGVVSVKTSHQYHLQHIGDVFIVVKKEFWGYGIATILLEEVIEWATQNVILKRLELTVQTRNQRAVELYKKVGFEIEGLQKRGAYTEEGEYLDIYLMGKLID